MAERGERRLQGHGQHAGRPPVQGGRSAGTHVELGGVGSAQDFAQKTQPDCIVLYCIAHAQGRVTFSPPAQQEPQQAASRPPMAADEAKELPPAGDVSLKSRKGHATPCFRIIDPPRS